MDKTTEELTNEINMLNSKEKLTKFLQTNEVEQNPDPRKYVMAIISKNGIRECDFRKATLLESSRLSHILNGDRNLSREICLTFAIAGKFTTDEVNYLLKYCGHRPLYLRDKRDSVIYFCIKQKLTLTRTNLYLADYSLPIIPAPREGKAQ